MANIKPHIIASSLFFLLIVCSYIIMALKFPIAYILATYEDFFGEWAQVFLFLTVFIISFKLAFVNSKFRFFFIILTLASFYTFMEEISWGQRIFNISSPEFFMQHNLQRETNIHNFLTGPYSTTLKSFIEYVLFTGLIFYGLLYPIALSLRLRFAHWIESKGIPSPPLYLWPYFVVSAVLELGTLLFNEAEIAEILIPAGLSIFLLHYMFAYQDKASTDTFSLTFHDSSNYKKLALAICGIFVLVATLSTGATYASYSSPELKSRMDNKLLNGVKKFAGRYKQYEMWETAIYLYKTIDEREPYRPAIKRNLSYCYKKTGNTELEKFYIEKAFDIDRQKLIRMPDYVPANLSIAYTYKQIENIKKEKYHLDKALEDSLKRVKNEPNGASAAYWLGNTYAQRGDIGSALTYYEKAFNLNPGKKKYRKAYMRTKSLVKGEVETSAGGD